ncbi:histidine phosphatase family protein [Thalassotalea nanhaiensis]|uniref:Histidine phosphatase family protein n=1 Tax=Thalassotalea nanhaiensis TaxID=3065648 RepID=A0ABY9TP60_9GAMM|nr:histidine phosphatase family protein [Colwelliaceae bacterium SQ345]
MTSVYLLRHGKVAGPPALYGHTDIGVITEHDEQLLTELLKVQDSFTHIVSSPLKRCQNLAVKLANSSGLPIVIDEQLKEIDFGELDGIAFETAKQHWPMLESFWQNPAKNPLPDAENLTAFNQRMLSVFNQLIVDYKDENVLVICHGGVIRMLLSIVLELDWTNPKLFSSLRVENGSICKLVQHPSSNFCEVYGIGLPISNCARSLSDD